MLKQRQIHDFLWLECDVVLAELLCIQIGKSKQNSVVKIQMDGNQVNSEGTCAEQNSWVSYHGAYKGAQPLFSL